MSQLFNWRERNVLENFNQQMCTDKDSQPNDREWKSASLDIFQQELLQPAMHQAIYAYIVISAQMSPSMHLLVSIMQFLFDESQAQALLHRLKSKLKSIQRTRELILLNTPKLWRSTVRKVVLQIVEFEAPFVAKVESVQTEIDFFRAHSKFV